MNDDEKQSPSEADSTLTVHSFITLIKSSLSELSNFLDTIEPELNNFSSYSNVIDRIQSVPTLRLFDGFLSDLSTKNTPSSTGLPRTSTEADSSSPPSTPNNPSSRNGGDDQDEDAASSQSVDDELRPSSTAPINDVNEEARQCLLMDEDEFEEEEEEQESTETTTNTRLKASALLASMKSAATRISSAFNLPRDEESSSGDGEQEEVKPGQSNDASQNKSKRARSDQLNDLLSLSSDNSDNDDRPASTTLSDHNTIGVSSGCSSGSNTSDHLSRACVRLTKVDDLVPNLDSFALDYSNGIESSPPDLSSATIIKASASPVDGSDRVSKSATPSSPSSKSVVTTIELSSATDDDQSSRRDEQAASKQPSRRDRQGRFKRKLSSSSTSSESIHQTRRRTRGGKVAIKTDSSSSSDDQHSPSPPLTCKRMTQKVARAKRRLKRQRLISNSSSASEQGDDEEDSDGNVTNKDEVEEKSAASPSRTINDNDVYNNNSLSSRRNTRKIYTQDKLSTQTKSAEAEERDRRKRILERQKLYNEINQLGPDSDTSRPKQIVLDQCTLDDDKTGKQVIEIHPELLEQLKGHQIEAIRFIWDCLVESISHYNSKNGETGGAVLAHCMGLGKTLSVIAFIHTVLNDGCVARQALKPPIRTCLVICPLNTVLNWRREFDQWLPDQHNIQLYDLVSRGIGIKDRIGIIKNWHSKGGVLLIGYSMFRLLVNASVSAKASKRRKADKELVLNSLLDPGPDLVVCDEGHMMKNSKTGLSIAVNKIRTPKRIVLTGTPLQNNLNEYHTMIDFVRPNLLGSVKEFNNRFANPIRNGQHSDSTKVDVKIMKKRAHVLYKTLDGCVQRKDYNSLVKYLPPRYEYIVMCRLTSVQCKLYRAFLDKIPTSSAYSNDSTGASSSSSQFGTNRLFTHYQNFFRIWTHPYMLRIHETREARKMILNSSSSEEADSADCADDDESSVDNCSSSSETSSASSDDENDAVVNESPSLAKVRRSRRNRSAGNGNNSDSERCSTPSSISNVFKPKQWWYDFYDESFNWRIDVGVKLDVLMRVLKKCSDIGDKVIVFTQSLLSLDLIERFLGELDRQWTVKEAGGDPELVQSAEQDVQEQRRPNLSEYFAEEGGYNSWAKGRDYERLDGSMSALTRKDLQARFNDPRITRLRLLLISTRAGGIGINLVSANRLVVFDASWNPSHDLQSIFRSYRFGQVKPVYIYRLIAQGTMEETIYDRQVVKQSLSLRVIDEQQIDRHFTNTDCQTLYNFTPDLESSSRETIVPPKDRLLAELLSEQGKLIVRYHNHDSLLEHREDEGLTEAERQEAWHEFEEEKRLGMTLAERQRMMQLRIAFDQLNGSGANMQQQLLVQNRPMPVGGRNYVGNQEQQRNLPGPGYRPVPPVNNNMPTLGNSYYRDLFERLRNQSLMLRPDLSNDPVLLNRLVTEQLTNYIMQSISKPVTTPVAEGTSNSSSQQQQQSTNAPQPPKQRRKDPHVQTFIDLTDTTE